MLNESEIRMKNLISLSETNELFLVIETSWSGFRVRNKTEDTWIERSEFEGVKISEQLLLDYGFSIIADQEFKLYAIAIENSEVEIVVSSANGVWIGCAGNDVGIGERPYFHQIQNLYFDLAGKELTKIK